MVSASSSKCSTTSTSKGGSGNSACLENHALPPMVPVRSVSSIRTLSRCLITQFHRLEDGTHLAHWGLNDSGSSSYLTFAFFTGHRSHPPFGRESFQKSVRRAHHLRKPCDIFALSLLRSVARKRQPFETGVQLVWPGICCSDKYLGRTRMRSRAG